MSDLMKHTPGPWNTVEQMDKCIMISARGTDKYGMDRLEIEVLDDDCSHNTAIANVAMARTAPDFFDACARLVPVLEMTMAMCCGMSDEGHTDDCPLQAVKAALLKAKTVPEGFELWEDDDD